MSSIPASGSIGYTGAIMANRNNQMGALLGVKNYDHKSFLVTSGLNEKATLQIYEDAIEGNEFWGGDGVDKNLLSWGAYYNDTSDSDSYNEYIFQGQGDPNIGKYTEIDFTTGTYKQYGEDGLFEQFFTKDPASAEKPYDFVNFGQGTINFFEFTMTDEKGSALNPITFTSTGSAGKRQGAGYIFQNINPFDSQSSATMSGLLNSSSLWMSKDEQGALESLAKKGDQEAFMSLYRQILCGHFDPTASYK